MSEAWIQINRRSPGFRLLQLVTICRMVSAVGALLQNHASVWGLSCRRMPAAEGFAADDACGLEVLMQAFSGV